MELASVNELFNFNGSRLNFFIKVNETNPFMKYWIIANEVAGDILHYRTPRHAIDKFCPNKIPYGEAIARGWVFQPARIEPACEAVQIRDPKTLIIPISDVGRLIANSKLRIAKIMSNWMYDEVFPSIIISGGYQLPNAVPQIQYVEKPHEEKIIEYQTMQCGCEYTPGAGTLYEQCSCVNKDLRIQKRRENVAEGELLKGGVSRSSGKKGGLQTQANNRATREAKLRLQKENGDLISRNAELELLLMNLNLNDE